MRIKVISVSNTPANEIVVGFHTEIGAGEAIWHGRILQIGYQYDIEFEVVDKLIWGSNIVFSDNAMMLSGNIGNLMLQGQVETVDDDGTIVLRLGASILVINVEGDDPLVGSFVKITATNVPYNV